MSRTSENTGFTCARCGGLAPPLTNGSYRNHCPFCLYSLHVDNRPGDRSNTCRGLMEPAGIRRHSRKGWQLVHRCLSCGAEQVNRVAEQDACPDDPDGILALVREGHSD